MVTRSATRQDCSRTPLADQLSEGAALITEIGAYGPGGRAHYEPCPADPRRWGWCGDTP
ncbi:hypothetical protein ACIGZJ_34370 [Kitasatospora sp. NPDC052868]|uniref:hypothetical protein n=1 Tax=Kitasatospora sp. NPDC052868 TaxID=3364060 RepID=UPI0037C984B7